MPKRGRIGHMAGRNLFDTLKIHIKERFTSTWKLLSATGSYLSRTRDYSRYEQQLHQLLFRLQTHSTNSDEIEIIRKEILLLRKTLRSQGHDLSLGTYFISFQDFRNDASLGEGFRRLVIHITQQRIYYIYGQENHVTLTEFLEQKITPLLINGQFVMRNYLWYKWQGNTLALSGSDSESQENFERLKAFGGVNMLFMLKWLKDLP